MIRLISLVLALSAAGCATGSGGDGRTILVEGRVFDPAGAPVSGAAIEATAGVLSGEAVSGPDGRYRMEALRPPRGFPLPVSGVFRRDVELTARTEDATGYSQAQALSISERAESRADFILLPDAELTNAQALLDRRDPACGAGEGRAWAHAMLDRLESGAIVDASRIEGLPLRLEALVMGARADCGLSEANWRGDLATIEAAFGPDSEAP